MTSDSTHCSFFPTFHDKETCPLTSVLSDLVRHRIDRAAPSREPPVPTAHHILLLVCKVFNIILGSGPVSELSFRRSSTEIAVVSSPDAEATCPLTRTEAMLCNSINGIRLSFHTLSTATVLENLIFLSYYVLDHALHTDIVCFIAPKNPL